MPEETSPKEPFDIYADQFLVTITPFGANLTFGVREPHASTGKVPETRWLGTVRMSAEHLKTMVMMVQRQVVKVEEGAGVKAEVSRQILAQFGIQGEDWDKFWSA